MSSIGRTVQKYVNTAPLLYKALNCVFVIHKPESIHFEGVRHTIVSNLCRDLNESPQRPTNKHIAIVGETNKNMKVVVRDSYADNILVTGPHYQVQDFRLGASNIMKMDTSGVLICGLNSGNGILHKLRESKTTRRYRLKGLLGQATDNYFLTGKIVEKSTYEHVKRGHLDVLCSSMQSSHQKKMFELCGVDVQSQAAYELAVKGLLRPANSRIPMLYTIKCVDFSPPEFSLEIVCINEHEMYLKSIIHDLGKQLRSTATCTKILCTQDGLFNINHALLKKHWDLENILHNMHTCRQILKENEHLMNQDSPTLIEHNENSTDSTA